MRRLILLVCIGMVAAGLSYGAFAQEGEQREGRKGKEVTLEGELIDTACYIASEGGAKGLEHAECGSKCLASGIPAGILPRDGGEDAQLLFLLTNPVPLAEHVGRTIRVEGKQYDHARAVDPARVLVQEEGEWKEIALQDEHHNMGGGGDGGHGHEGHEGHGHRH